jgi:alanine transaminase
LFKKKRSYQESLARCEPRAIIVINPGNPTGQVFTEPNMKDIIAWAYEKGLFIIADEVYQDNVYMPGMQFHSFKKVAQRMGPPYSHIQMASFYSTSKGFVGECGARAGYFEIVNLDADVKAQFKKLQSTQLCSSILGQACMDALVYPPAPDQPSYELFMRV